MRTEWYLGTLADGAGTWVGTYVVHSTLITLTAMAVCWLLRRRAFFALENWLWRVALVAPLVSATLATWRAESALFEWQLETQPLEQAPPPSEGSPATLPAAEPLRVLPEPALPSGAVRTGPPELFVSVVRGAAQRGATLDGQTSASVFDAPASARSFDAPALARSFDVPLPPQVEAAPAPSFDVVEDAALADLAVQSSGLAARAPAHAATLRRVLPSASWRVLLLGLVALSGAALLVLGVRVVALRAALARRQPLVAGEYWVAFQELCARSGVTHGRLSVCADLATPVALSGREVCVPTWMLHTDLARFRAAVAHELGHVVRRDPWWLGVALLLEALFAFQPLLRLVRRRWQDCSEYLCDEWAVQLTGNGLDLAKSLVEVLTMKKRGSTPKLLPAMASRPLRQRVQRLLDATPDEPRRQLRGHHVGVTLAGVLGVGLFAPVVIMCAPRTSQSALTDASSPPSASAEPAPGAVAGPFLASTREDAGDATPRRAPAPRRAPRSSSQPAPLDDEPTPPSAPPQPPAFPEVPAPPAFSELPEPPAFPEFPKPPTPPATVPPPPAPPNPPEVARIVAEATAMLPKAQNHAEELRALSRQQRDSARELRLAQTELERLRNDKSAAATTQRRALEQRIAVQKQKLADSNKRLEARGKQLEQEMEVWEREFEKRMDAWSDELSSKFDAWEDKFEKEYEKKLETWQKAHGKEWEVYAAKVAAWGEKYGQKWEQWGERQAERAAHQAERAAHQAERAARAAERAQEHAADDDDDE